MDLLLTDFPCKESQCVIVKMLGQKSRIYDCQTTIRGERNYIKKNNKKIHREKTLKSHLQHFKRKSLLNLIYSVTNFSKGQICPIIMDMNKSFQRLLNAFRWNFYDYIYVPNLFGQDFQLLEKKRITTCFILFFRFFLNNHMTEF